MKSLTQTISDHVASCVRPRALVACEPILMVMLTEARLGIDQWDSHNIAQKSHSLSEFLTKMTFVQEHVIAVCEPSPSIA